MILLLWFSAHATGLGIYFVGDPHSWILFNIFRLSNFSYTLFGLTLSESLELLSVLGANDGWFSTWLHITTLLIDIQDFKPESIVDVTICSIYHYLNIFHCSKLVSSLCPPQRFNVRNGDALSCMLAVNVHHFPHLHVAVRPSWCPFCVVLVLFSPAYKGYSMMQNNWTDHFIFVVL